MAADQSTFPLFASQLRKMFPKEYLAWKNLRKRAFCRSNPSFKYVGGRGFTVCERWNSFEAFFEDMGPAPSKDHSIDREDNDKGYSPDNCRWATSLQQMANTRTARILEHDGLSLPIGEWVRRTGIPHATITFRLGMGWSVADALTVTPVMGRNRFYRSGAQVALSEGGAARTLDLRIKSPLQSYDFPAKPTT